jgi:hypothetical protein
MKAITTVEVDDIMAAWKAAKESVRSIATQACDRLRDARERFEEATGGQCAPREYAVADGDLKVTISPAQITIYVPGLFPGGLQLSLQPYKGRDDFASHWSIKLAQAERAARLLETVTADAILARFAAELAERG